MDGSRSSIESGAGIVLQDPYGNQTLIALRLYYAATNNEAKYKTLLGGLKLTITLTAENVKVKSDSQLMVNQVKEEYHTK